MNRIEFEDIVNGSDRPVVVDFTAEWCGPCRLLGPALHEIAEGKDAFRLVVVDVDQSPDVARQFSVMSMPTVMVFADGVERARFVGWRGKTALERDIAGVVARAAGAAR